MPEARIKPNPQLRKIVLEETNDGRDVVRYLKSTFMQVEDGVSLFGLRHKDYARSHKIAATRNTRKSRPRRRKAIPQEKLRPHSLQESSSPKTKMGQRETWPHPQHELYRLVKTADQRDGADIMVHFVEIVKGYHPEGKPHPRMAAAKELIRHIEFDYDEPTSTTA